jgi:hypothetical protein
MVTRNKVCAALALHLGHPTHFFKPLDCIFFGTAFIAPRLLSFPTGFGSKRFAAKGPAALRCLLVPRVRGSSGLEMFSGWTSAARFRPQQPTTAGLCPNPFLTATRAKHYAQIQRQLQQSQSNSVTNSGKLLQWLSPLSQALSQRQAHRQRPACLQKIIATREIC